MKKQLGILTTIVLLFLAAVEAHAEKVVFAPPYEYLNCKTRADHSRAMRWVYKTMEEINFQSNFSDVSDDVQKVIAVSENCRLEKREFPHMFILSSLERKGYVISQHSSLNRLRRRAQYGDPTPEVERFRYYAGKLKTKIDESDINRSIEQGKQSALVEEKSCSAIDFRSKMPPVRDQDGVGWCYAFAAADLVSFKTGKNISPIAISTQFNEGFFNSLRKRFTGLSEQEISGGYVHEALAKSQKNGFCLESELNSSDVAFANISATVAKIEALREKRGKGLTCDEYTNVRSIFKSLSQYEVEKVLEESSNASFFSDLVERSCKTKILEASQFKIKTERAAKGAEYKAIKKIESQLEKGNIVAIAYDFDMLDTDPRDRSSSYHASTVIGRRWNSKTRNCELLIRNSYGRGCSSYRKEIDCDQGNLWIPKHLIDLYLTRVDYLE